MGNLVFCLFFVLLLCLASNTKLKGCFFYGLVGELRGAAKSNGFTEFDKVKAIQKEVTQKSRNGDTTTTPVPKNKPARTMKKKKSKTNVKKSK